MADAKTEKQKVQEITEKLEQGIKELFESEKYKTYLNTMSKFHNYSFTETDDGRLLFSADYTDMENLVTWLMTFGAKAEVLEPEEVRDIICRNAEEIIKIYGGLGK